MTKNIFRLAWPRDLATEAHILFYGTDLVYSGLPIPDLFAFVSVGSCKYLAEGFVARFISTTCSWLSIQAETTNPPPSPKMSVGKPGTAVCSIPIVRAQYMRNTRSD